ncbi:MAG: exosortase/archaeosortase family protein [Acidobacteria bacterium]|nr:exosortase/archaeosortase family protein [Acidobacteriota bacterium]
MLLLCLEVALLFGPTVAWLWDRWTMSVWQNAHGMFIPPLAAWLAWQALKGRPDLPADGSRWGFALLVPALAVHAIDAGIHTQLLSAAALFLALPGLALLLLGGARVRLIAFPLVLLFFAIPIPLGFTEPLQLVLRQIAASTTAAVLPMLGVPVFREGTLLDTTAGTVSISDACSGFSTLYAAVTVAALVAYLAPSWRRRLLVLAAAAPVAIAANLLRVIALTLMVAWGEGWLLETFVHPLSGMLTFALALPVLFWLGEPGKTEVAG